MYLFVHLQQYFYIPVRYVQIADLTRQLDEAAAQHAAEMEDEQVRSQQEVDKLLDVSEEFKDELERYKDMIEDLKADNESKVRTQPCMLHCVEFL